MKKKRVLKSWIKYSLVGIIAVVLIFVLLKIDGDMQQGFIENCEIQGYTHNYCVVHS